MKPSVGTVNRFLQIFRLIRVGQTSDEFFKIELGLDSSARLLDRQNKLVLELIEHRVQRFQIGTLSIVGPAQDVQPLQRVRGLSDDFFRNRKLVLQWTAEFFDPSSRQLLGLRPQVSSG